MAYKIFEASEQLATILLKNGFVETTLIKYPHHAERMKIKGYDPNSVKRCFSLSKSIYINFDYINILPYYKGFQIRQKNNACLSEPELRSIIAFFKLKRHNAVTIASFLDKLPALYSNIASHPEGYPSASYQKFKVLYESVDC